MSKRGQFVFSLTLCLVTVFGFFYVLLWQKNRQTQLRLSIPQEMNKIQQIKNEIALLETTIWEKENPAQLVQWSKDPTLLLTFPSNDEILVIYNKRPLHIGKNGHKK